MFDFVKVGDIVFDKEQNRKGNVIEVTRSNGIKIEFYDSLMKENIITHFREESARRDLEKE